MSQSKFENGEGREDGLVNTNRPRLNIPRTQLELFCELFAAAAVIWLTLYLLVTWGSLPVSIPVHFNVAGEANRWGSRNGLLFLYGVLAAMYAGLSMLQRFPHICNYPFDLTSQNVRQQYLLARQLLVFLKTEVVGNLAFITWQTLQVARGRSQTLGGWFAPVFLLMIFGTIAWYIIAARKAR
jgi:hypothetical protein